MNLWWSIDIINKFIDKIIYFIISRFFPGNKNNEGFKQGINSKGDQNNQRVINVGTQNIYNYYGVNPNDIPSVKNEPMNVTGTVSIKIKNNN